MSVERSDASRVEIVTSQEIKKYEPTSELELRGSKIAEKAHDGILRKSGEPYIEHCRATAAILDAWGISDPAIKAAAWAHDTLEDCDWITFSYLEEELGARVAFIVNGVTKFVSSESGKSNKIETHRKVLDNQYVDLGVALVKLADRVHNMSTLDSMSPRKQKEIGEETLNVYAPLAQALGMWDIRNFLQDYAFRYVDPLNYELAKLQIDNDPRLNKNFLAHYTSSVCQALEEEGIVANIEPRIGGYWDLFKKRERLASEGLSNLDSFTGINDVVSIRVQTNSVTDCYRSIGVLHQKFGELIDLSKYDEYLGANKRDNGYESLQTTLSLPEGELEVAVTTAEKEQFNRWGVVYRMKEGLNGLQEYLLKAVLIENGDNDNVMFLHKNATGVDLAYTINNLIGATAQAVSVDGEVKPLGTVLPNASRVKIITGETRRAPDASLLKYCLPVTKRKIERQLNIQSRDNLVLQGRKRMEGILASRGFLVLEDLPSKTQNLINTLGCQSLDEVYFFVGRGNGLDNSIENWLNDEGIRKDTLGITTVRITGYNKSGILSEISTKITENKGNILNLNFKSLEENSYSLRLVVENLGSDGEIALKKYLSESDKYTKHEVV